MIMSTISYNPQILNTFERVRLLSFQEKRDVVVDEAKNNEFLDKILELKMALATKSESVNSLVDRIEEISWFNDLDNEGLMLVNDLIAALRDLHSSFLRQYLSLNFMRTEEIAEKEIKNFKNTIDDVKEAASDLESRFFFLPTLPDFQETTNELSLL